MDLKILLRISNYFFKWSSGDITIFGVPANKLAVLILLSDLAHQKL